MIAINTEYDFLQPEFLNILFFQQKSMVIFPYVDIKHLHSLEIFTAGYNVIELDSTALHNVSQILELEIHNSYSQTPCFFFITNITKEEIEKILSLEDVHCIININEVIELPQEDESFIFYNKKNQTFLNYTPDDLSFEKTLITESKNKAILQDRIMRIKSLATTLYNEVNEELSIKKPHLEKLLEDYNPVYWDKILGFTQRFYHIEIPKDSVDVIPANKSKISTKNSSLIDYSDEYHDIVAVNKYIGKEFIQVLHDYRAKKVNPANLELEQLYNPQKVYNYLRNHHWKGGVDEEFVKEWVLMKHTQYELTEDDLVDFQKICAILKTSFDILFHFSLNTSKINPKVKISHKTSIIKTKPMISLEKKEKTSKIPSISKFNQFKEWILKLLDELEEQIEEKK